MSSTVGDSAQATGTGDRLGLKPGMVVQELGWDNDTDDELRVAVEDCIDADMVDMESFAVCRACLAFGVPMVGLRGISDGAQPLSGYMDWTRYLRVIDDRLAAAIDRLSEAFDTLPA